MVSVKHFEERARAWLDAHAERRPDTDAETLWGRGQDSVAVFHAIDPEAERQLLKEASAWQEVKVEAGFGAIDYPRDAGGAGLTKAHARAFAAEEARFMTPPTTELFRVSVGLIAPTIARFGTRQQLRDLLPDLNAGRLWICQLFSEPDAGSDLASVRCHAERTPEGWRLSGQKVWTSGALVAHQGLLIARTDPSSRRHHGLTAFLVPMDSPGVEVRGIRQMTGGHSFSEVFLQDVEVPDAHRVGEVGSGWSVALAVLNFEREVSGETHEQVGGSVERLIGLGRHCDALADAVIRDRLLDLYVRDRVLTYYNLWAPHSSHPTTVSGSIGKLLWTDKLRRTSELAGSLLGPRLTADTGAWGEFCWTEHVLGAPGFRIAGGTDEIQRNILAERGLGLPREPRPDGAKITVSPTPAERDA